MKKIRFTLHQRFFYAYEKGGYTMYWAFVIGVIVFSGYLVGGIIPSRFPDLTQRDAVTLSVKRYVAALPVLQLGSLKTETSGGAAAASTSTPKSASTPRRSNSPACHHDDGLPAAGLENPQSMDCTCEHVLVSCSSGRITSMIDGFSRKPISTASCSENPGTLSNLSCRFYSEEGYWCKTIGNVPRPDGVYCLAKPVIYLYPQETMTVDVRVQFENGYVYISDPTYDTAFHGWDDVLAHPGGSLTYRGGTYHELYYETATDAVLPPPNGIIVPTAILEKRLQEITHQLGLQGKEQDEFLSYWLPKLQELHAPYLLVSLITPPVKKQIDEVVITPQPDTFIEILFYFKPLSYPTAIIPLKLPETPPQRVGFTAVEWGGTIDFDNNPKGFNILH